MNEKKKQPGFFSQLLLGFLVTKATGSVIHHFKENKRKRDQEWHDTVFWQEAIRRKESEDFNDDYSGPILWDHYISYFFPTFVRLKN